MEFTGKQKEGFQQIVTFAVAKLGGVRLTETAAHLGSGAQDDGLTVEQGMEKAKKYAEYQEASAAGKDIFELCFRQAYTKTEDFEAAASAQDLPNRSSENADSNLSTLLKHFTEQQIVKAGVEACNAHFGWGKPGPNEQAILEAFGLSYDENFGKILVS